VSRTVRRQARSATLNPEEHGVMDSKLGAWLRQQREDRGWTKAEMARRLTNAARDAGDKAIPDHSGMLHNLHRWEREGGVSERYKLYYCRIFSIHPSQFGPDTNCEPADATASATTIESSPADVVPAQARAATPELACPHLTPSVLVAYGGRQEAHPGLLTVEQEVLMAAHESSDHAAEHEQQGIGETTFEQLHADLVRLSRLTDAGPPLTAFLEARRVRDRVYRLLDRRLWPREQTDLYFVLGCVNGLMGITANRLGYPDAAEELIRAGWAYANIIDHNALRGMLRAKLSTVMYWRGRFREASDLATDGLQYVPQGPLGANLHLNHACAAARLGDPDTARQAVRLAHEARESDYRDDIVEIGGEEFSLSRATTYAKAGRALVDTGADGREAAGELDSAIGLYDQVGTLGEEHWFGGKALAGTDLAVVLLRSGALDGATTALGPVLALPPGQRVATLTTRLAQVREELAAPVFRDSPQARALGDQIEVFGREAVTAGLHSLSG
jgi:tetratricopeptide (TPR) repeat protein